MSLTSIAKLQVSLALRNLYISFNLHKAYIKISVLTTLIDTKYAGWQHVAKPLKWVMVPKSVEIVLYSIMPVQNQVKLF